MQKHSFSPKISYSPYSFVLAKTTLRSDVVCRCLPKSSDTGVVANTKGEEMMTSCCRIPLLLLVLVAQPLACTRLWYHEKIGGGRELELLQTHSSYCFSICSYSTSFCLMLLLRGQDISCSCKYKHRTCDRTSLTTTSPSKKTLAKIRHMRVSRSERRTITKRAKM
jgi:hypothetical protein